MLSPKAYGGAALQAWTYLGVWLFQPHGLSSLRFRCIEARTRSEAYHGHHDRTSASSASNTERSHDSE
jgi:hypothetical protein